MSLCVNYVIANKSEAATRQSITFVWRRASLFLFQMVLVLALPACLYADIRVTPTITQLNLLPGEEKRDSFSVYNEGNKQASVEVEIDDLFKQPTEKIEVNSWIEVEPKRFNIGPGEIKSIDYKVNVPVDYEGELRCRVFFAAQDQAVGNVGIKNRFGVAIYVAIKGTEVVKADILDISISEIKTGTDTKDIGFSVIVQNKSNVHIRPRGKLVIKTEGDSLVKELELPYGYPIMPGSSHSYYVVYEKCDLAPARYKTTALVQYGDEYNFNKNCEKESFFIVTR